MTKAKITDYSVTAASNTDVQDISLAEGWLPATVNNMFRAFLAHVANASTGVSGWLTLQNTITAGTTQTQAGATAITGPLARVTTCANANDGVKLPTCAAEVMITVMNLGATNLQVWPNTSDTINGGSADAVDANVIPPNASRTYLGIDATDWRAVPLTVGPVVADALTALGIDNHSSIVVDANGIALNATQPCFLAHGTGDQTNVESNGGTATTVAFGTEVFDQNSDFASNTFTAPVTGRYSLYAKVDVSGITSACTNIEVRLVTSNAFIPFGRHASSSTSFTVAVFTATMTVDMDAGDTAYVTYQGTGEAGDVHDINGGRGYTEFGGILLA